MVALTVVAATASAQQFPTKPVRIVVPFAPGGGVDTVTRAVGNKLTEAWKYQVIVDNRPGAGGNIAADTVAKAAADGYTLLVTNATLSISPSLYRQLPFDPVKDLVPVTQMTSNYIVLVGSPKFKAKSLKELIALAKAKPGAINYGSSGIGGALLLLMVMIKSHAGVDIVHIPYKGDAEVMRVLLTNEVQVAVMPTATVAQPIKDGRLNAFGITSRAREAAFPEVPTLDEAGLPGFFFHSWMGIFAPRGTPADIVNVVQREVAKALATPDMKERLASLGFEPVGSTPKELEAMFKSDIAMNAKAIVDANIPQQD
jgi:tripartite-type tricarboxylate transporter receptor subunit TctC